MNIAEGVAQKLLQINAIILSPQNPFTWASGIRSPIYCDNRISLSYPAIRTYILEALLDKSREFAPFDTVAGVATAGIPQASMIAHVKNLPLIYIRSSSKRHGRKNLIEGHVQPGSRILVIEDLISTGGSSLKAVDALRQAGHSVAGVLAVFSYDLKIAQENFAKAGCRWGSLVNYRDILKVAEQEGIISETDTVVLNQWSADPENWKK
jgi:orotate phosphoribosyltransferase